MLLNCKPYTSKHNNRKHLKPFIYFPRFGIDFSDVDDADYYTNLYIRTLPTTNTTYTVYDLQPCMDDPKLPKWKTNVWL